MHRSASGIKCETSNSTNYAYRSENHCPTKIGLRSVVTSKVRPRPNYGDPCTGTETTSLKDHYSKVAVPRRSVFAITERISTHSSAYPPENRMSEAECAKAVLFGTVSVCRKITGHNRTAHRET